MFTNLNGDLMNKMQVFRIEDGEGRGFYYSSIGYDIMEGECDPDAHPMPMRDSKYAGAHAAYADANPQWDIRHHIFGFVSVAQLRRWFYCDSWIQGMSDAGMHVCVYETDAEHTLVGRTQLTFPPTSRCVGRFDPAWLLTLE